MTTIITATTLLKQIRHYPMVDFYLESRRFDVTENTNFLCKQRLSTFFDDLTSNYGVIVNADLIERLNGEVLQTWYNTFMQDKKPSTANNYVAFINPFLRWAYAIGYIAVDISHLLHTAKVPTAEALPEWERPKEKLLSHSEVTGLLEEAGETGFKERNQAIVALFVYSGIRVEELCSLTIGCVRRKQVGLIHCRRKGGAWKDVEVASAFYPYLKEYLKTRRDADDYEAPLFASKSGRPMTRSAVYAMLRPLQDKLGCCTGSHVLRHTYVSEVEKIGGVAVARDLANHKSIRITNRYDHSSLEERRACVEAIDWCPVKALNP